MFATGAIGAIFGTLLAGFFFVPRLGSMTTLMVIAVIYALAAVVCFALARVRGRDLGVGFAACLALVGLGYQTLSLPAICDEESEYFCIRTVTLSDAEGARVHLMVLDHLAHGISGEAEPRQMQTDHAAMLDALPRMRMGEKDFSSFHIGGGSFSVPRGWAAHGLGQITVAEIDPAVTQVAIDDFWLPADQVTVLHEDARMALRNTPTRYDVIIGDAFTDIAVPEHLITQEFFELVASRLTDGGVFAMNLIDHVDRMDALAAMIVTLQAVFPSVEVWTEARGPSMGERRIFVLLCGETPSPVSRLTAGSPDPMIFQPLDDAFVAQIVADKQPRVLTDDYAPISALIGFEPILN
jgi:predicted membrane-bound spermidine synthase